MPVYRERLHDTCTVLLDHSILDGDFGPHSEDYILTQLLVLNCISGKLGSYNYALEATFQRLLSRPILQYSDTIRCITFLVFYSRCHITVIFVLVVAMTATGNTARHRHSYIYIATHSELICQVLLRKARAYNITINYCTIFNSLLCNTIGDMQLRSYVLAFLTVYCTCNQL